MIDDDFEESFNDTTDEDESNYDDDENAWNYKNEYHLCLDDVSWLFKVLAHQGYIFD